MAPRVGAWARAALGRHELRTLRLARFGDNMRDVAVTEGDKVEAAAAVRRLGQHLRRQRPGRCRRRGRRRRTSTSWSTEYADTYRRRARAAARRGAARVAALRRPHRAGPAGVPRGGRLRRLHHELRGPRRAAPAPGSRRAAADGRRLRLRRRGRLEDLGAAARDEGDGRRPARRHVVHGGLHVPPGPRARRRSSVRTCSRSARRIAAEQPTLEIHPLVDRRARGPGAAALHRRPGPRGRRRALRPRRPLPADRQRDRRGRARRARCRSCRWPARSGSRAPRCRRRPSRG